MTTKTPAKRKAVPKQTRAVRAEPKGVVQRFDAVLEPANVRWTLPIEPGVIAVITQKIWGVFVAIGNKGPATVLASTGRDQEKITPNALRLILIQGQLTIESMDGTPATVELEFMPQAK